MCLKYILICLFQAAKTVPVVCKTKNHYGACVFPFNYKNKQYHGCTRADENGGYTFDTPWCAFKVKANGDLDGTNWERCDMTTCLGNSRL